MYSSCTVTLAFFLLALTTDVSSVMVQFSTKRPEEFDVEVTTTTTETLITLVNTETNWGINAIQNWGKVLEPKKALGAQSPPIYDDDMLIGFVSWTVGGFGDCMSDECTGRTLNYRGTVSVTESGKRCQHWNTKEPHYHPYVPEDRPDLDLIRNYCRAPDGAATPWCYTTDTDTRWEFCNVELDDFTEPEIIEYEHEAKSAEDMALLINVRKAGGIDEIHGTDGTPETERTGENRDTGDTEDTRYPGDTVDTRYAENTGDVGYTEGTGDTFQDDILETHRRSEDSMPSGEYAFRKGDKRPNRIASVVFVRTTSHQYEIPVHLGDTTVEQLTLGVNALIGLPRDKLVTLSQLGRELPSRKRLLEAGVGDGDVLVGHPKWTVGGK